MAKNTMAENNAANKPRKMAVVFFIGSIIALILSFLLDDAAFRLMDIIKNPVLDFLMGAIMSYWSVIAMAMFFTVILFWSKKQRYAPWMWLSIVMSWVLCYCLKFIFIRPRPENAGMLLPLLGINDYSFPSGHATTAAATVPALGKALPALKWLWILIAAVFAFSRVYLGVHHLSDVVAGAILGMIVGELFLHFQLRKKSGKQNGKRKTA